MTCRRVTGVWSARQSGATSAAKARLGCVVAVGLALGLGDVGGAWAHGGPPFITDDPGTPGPLRWEINLAVTLARAPDAFLVQTPSVDVNFGLGERVEVNYTTAMSIVGVSGESAEVVLDNSSFHVKWRFLDRQTAPLEMSVRPQVFFNPVSRTSVGLLDRHPTMFFPIELQAALGPVTLAAEAGYATIVDATDVWSYGIVASRSMGRALIGVEAHGLSDASFSRNVLVVNLGTVVRLVGDDNLLAALGASPEAMADGELDLVAYLGYQLKL